MKILFDMIDYQVGGIQKVNTLIANHYVSLGYDVHLIGPRIGDHQTYNLDKKITLHWFSSDTISIKMAELKQHLKHNSYDVYFSGLHTKLRFVAFLSGVPRIIHILHNTYDYNIREKLIESFLRFRTEYVAVSNAVADYTSKVLPIPRKRIKTIYNAVDIDLFHPQKRSVLNPKMRICSVGRLVHQKGFDKLIDVIAECKKRKLPMHFTIYGDGDQFESLKQKAYSLDLDKNYLTLAGECKEIYKVLPNYDCFVSTLRYGGFEIVLAEAMACGVPVIAFDVGPVKEVIGNHSAGVLIEKGDVQQFADKLEYFINHREELLERGNECRERVVTNFSSQIMKQKYTNLLKKV